MAALLLMVAWNMSEAHKVINLLRHAPKDDIVADSGSQESSGARISSAMITSRAWITAATGDVAPARTFAAGCSTV
jgi:hypothetical protein